MYKVIKKGAVSGKIMWRILLQKKRIRKARAYENDALNALLARESKRAFEEEEEDGRFGVLDAFRERLAVERGGGSEEEEEVGGKSVVRW